MNFLAIMYSFLIPLMTSLLVNSEGIEKVFSKASLPETCELLPMPIKVYGIANPYVNFIRNYETVIRGGMDVPKFQV